MSDLAADLSADLSAELAAPRVATPTPTPTLPVQTLPPTPTPTPTPTPARRVVPAVCVVLTPLHWARPSLRRPPTGTGVVLRAGPWQVDVLL